MMTQALNALPASQHALHIVLNMRSARLTAEVKGRQRTSSARQGVHPTAFLACLRTSENMYAGDTEVHRGSVPA